jgi:Kelch motif
MKKIVFLVLFAALMGFALTSCQKEENFLMPKDLTSTAADVSGVVTERSASDAWTVLQDVPHNYIGVEGMSVASIGNKIYAVCGYDAGDTKTTRIYDIATDTWSTGADAPSQSSEGVGLAHDGLFYNVGGRGGASNYFWSYDPVYNVWNSMLAPMPTNRIGLAAAVVGDYIYAIGGRTGSAPNGYGKMNVVERYDIYNNAWTTVAPLPAARSDMAAAVVGGKIYIFGGFDAAGNVLNTVDVYNPVTNTWTIGLTPMPTPRGSMYAVAKKGGTVYVIGGWNGVYPFNTSVGSKVEAYKVASNTWTTGYTSMPTARSESGAADHGGLIYIIGGATPGGGASVSANEVYKP